MQEWENYKFNSSDDEVPLSTVYHIVHFPDARRIFVDGRLRAGLIYDESKLNSSRICVTWLSANTWGPGSIYGNVQFAFDWADIIESRQIYWVEAMTRYKTPAYRFLLTENDMSGSEDVVLYDPEKDKGPLRKRGKEWFCNTKYTSEFMIEADLSLNDCTGLSFVSHHSKECRMYGWTCAYKGYNAQRTAGRVLAFLLSSNINGIVRDLLREKQDGTVHLNSEADIGVHRIWRALGSREECFAGGIKKAKSRHAVLLGALALYGGEEDQVARELVALLNSQDIFEKALVEIIQEKLDIEDYELGN